LIIGAASLNILISDVSEVRRYRRATLLARFPGRRSGRMSDKRVLIIDGDTPARERLRRHFARRGWSVALAGTVAEAMARLDPPPHCIVLELTLGDDPGEAVLRQVVEENLPTRVLLCTGASDPVRLARAARLGPEAVFGKPFDVEEVVRACEAAGAIV
jgi:ActR/RegA family two-component response regulator